MNGTFVDIHAAADFIGTGAVEVPVYQSEITDIVRRRGVFGQRIKQVPATGHPSRFFEQTTITAPTASSGFVDPRHIVAPVVSPTRVQRSVPLKALVSEVNYHLFDMDIAKQQNQFQYLQAKDLNDAVDGVMRAHDSALWNGTDTLLYAPTTLQYFGVAGQICAGGNTHTIGTSGSIIDGFKEVVARMCANTSFQVKPTAIYANPVLLDLIDRELKAESGTTLSNTQLSMGLAVKVLPTQAGDIPLIPEWTLSYTGTPGSLASQYVAVKFGGVVVKGAGYAHYQVLVDR